MEVQGKIIQVLPLQTGTSKAGNPWKKQIYVLETADSFPKKVAFDFFGDKVDQYPLSVGDDIILSFDIESREFNGRWYTDIRGWRAEKSSGQPVGAPAAPAAEPFAPAPAPIPQDPSEDLPF